MKIGRITSHANGDVQNIMALINRVNEVSGKNKENIDILVREVSRFKVA
jgi:hypothetical protein